MNLLVNAISVREGGPLTVLEQLLPSMLNARPGLHITAIVPPSTVARLPAAARLRLAAHEAAERSPASLLIYYNKSLPDLCADYDALLSVTNYLPMRQIACPSVLLIQHAGHYADDFDQRMRAQSGSVAFAAWRAKRNWVRASARRASRVIVQTQALCDAMMRTPLPTMYPIRVIPHGPGVVTMASGARSAPHHTPVRIGYISKHGPQKNFETVLKACAALKERQAQFRLVLTLDERDRAFQSLREYIETQGLAEFIENHGDIPRMRIEELIDSLDIAVFASTVESFGFPMVEAMARALPVVVAHTPVGLEITGRAAMTFQPYDANALADCIAALSADRALYACRSEESLRRAQSFNWAQAGADTLGAIDAAIAQRVTHRRIA